VRVRIRVRAGVGVGARVEARVEARVRVRHVRPTQRAKVSDGGHGCTLLEEARVPG